MSRSAMSKTSQASAPESSSSPFGDVRAHSMRPQRSTGAAAGHLRPGDDPAHDAAPHHMHLRVPSTCPSSKIRRRGASSVPEARAMMAPGVAASNAAACASVSHSMAPSSSRLPSSKSARLNDMCIPAHRRGAAVTQNCRWPRRFRWVTRRFVNVTVPSRDDDAAVAAAATVRSHRRTRAHRAPGRLPRPPPPPSLVRPRMTETVSVQGKVRAEVWAQRTRVSVRGMGGGSGAGDADQLRVLCLHGFTQNGETFRQRTGSIRKQLKKKIDFVFIDAPHDASGAFGDDDASALGTAGDGVAPGRGGSSGERRGVRRRRARGARRRRRRRPDYIFVGRSRSSRAVAADARLGRRRGRHRRRRGNVRPFDGVLGFSQGASAAALALALVPSLRDTVRFAVLFSGFEPMDPAATAALHAARITTRSMHVHGHADRMVSRERTEALARSFRPSRVLLSRGRARGALSKESRDALRSFALNPAVNAATTTQLATSVTDGVAIVLLLPSFILL